MILRYKVLILKGIVIIAHLSCSSSTNQSHEHSRIQMARHQMTEETDGMIHMNLAGQEMAGSEFSNRYFLNFEGANIGPSQSFIVENAGQGNIEIPKFSVTDLGAAYANEDRTSIINNLKAKMEILFKGVDIEFYLEAPQAPYATLHIGGSNFTGRPNVLGVAPLDISNFYADDILFVFSKEFSNRGSGDSYIELAHTMAHEIAHSIGNRHIEHTEGIMNPIVSNSHAIFNVTGFLSSDDEVKENSFEVMQMNLGKADSSSLDSSLPEIIALEVMEHNSIVQISVYSPENFAANTRRDLTKFHYLWEFEGYSIEAPTFRTSLMPQKETSIDLTVFNPDKTEQKTLIL